MHEKEIWKDIPGYEGLYQVNQWGDIYSLYTHKKLKWSLHKDGYKQYNLHKNKKSYIMTAHRMETDLRKHNLIIMQKSFMFMILN